jgi:hypothetical protein
LYTKKFPKKERGGCPGLLGVDFLGHVTRFGDFFGGQGQAPRLGARPVSEERKQTEGRRGGRTRRAEMRRMKRKRRR